MKRRNFIKTAGTAVSLPVMLGGIPLSAMPKSSIFNFIEEETDRVLVLIQMNGGNDGLNMIIPRDRYDGLAAVRSNIMIAEANVIPVTDNTGFHPSMKDIHLLYEEGKISVVQSVGYPNQNRSHFRSIDIWTSGSPAEEFWYTGWMGRYFDTQYPGYPDDYPNETHPHPFAITMGSIVSETCQGRIANYSMTLDDPFNIFPLFEGEGDEIPDTPYGDELAFLRTSIVQTNEYSELIVEAANRGRNLKTYKESNRLARQLKNVALLVSGGLQTKIYIVSIGGFDTHANQVVEGNTAVGMHADLLEMLSDAIGTFQEDLRLQGLEHRVVGMTFSEFGRKVRSNESFGTDHGTAAPLILFGACVHANILGESPEISPDIDSSEGLPMQYDFRDVYGSLLMDWFGVEESQVRALLHPAFQYLKLIQPCSPVTATDDAPLTEPIQTYNYPNPFKAETVIAFQMPTSAKVRLSIFDALGAELRVLINKRLEAGDHQVTFQAQNLPAGTYFYRLQIGQWHKTKRMVKIL